MPALHHILTLARTRALALVYAWMCLSACIGMSASAWAIPHAHADTDWQSQAQPQSHLPAANTVVAIVTITAPANGAVGTAVPITANVTTASGAVLNKIEYFEGANSIGISSSASYAWTPLVPGIYTVTAKVTDSKGATGVSAPVIITVTDASGETNTFLHNDFAGSAIAATDAAGALLWKENYTPFGDRAVKAVNASGNRQWYTGKPVDSETGLSNFGARMYDPVVGRFMGVDAVGFGEGNLHSFNRYAYGNNNPYKFVDPDGNDAVDAIMSFALGPFQKIGLMLGMNQHRQARDYGSSMQDGGQYLKANLDGVQAIGDVASVAAAGAGLAVGVEAGALKASQRVSTEVVQRWMSQGELQATIETGLVRGGREGTHFASDDANSSATRARQRLALPQTPEVRVSLEVPQGAFSAPSKVEPKFNMPGGGSERTATGNVPASVVKVYE